MEFISSPESPVVQKRSATPLVHAQFQTKRPKFSFTGADLRNLDNAMNQYVRNLELHLSDTESVSRSDVISLLQQVAVTLTRLQPSNTLLEDRWRNLSTRMIDTLAAPDVEALKDIIFHCVEKGSWERLARHPCLLKDLPPAPRKYQHELMDVVSQEQATEKSWYREFVGDAATELWKHIVKFSNSPKPYARFCAIVQSSGMGKSRLVDELSKTTLVIPINLRERGTAGFPPADDQVRDYLSEIAPAQDLYFRHCAFLAALFSQTAETVAEDAFQRALEGHDMRRVASAFRARMSDGMTFRSHGPFREAFYQRVIADAKKIYLNIEAGTNELYDLGRAFERLRTILQNRPELGSSILEARPPKARSDSGAPLVVLAYDEAHSLFNLKDNSPSRSIVELRHALRSLAQKPLFSLFLSTSSEITRSTKPRDHDASLRIVIGDFMSVPTFTLTGFDQLARVIDNSTPRCLRDISTFDWISHLGRPMFGSRYDSGNGEIKDDISHFAKSKLLLSDGIPTKFSPSQQLACLSQRIPIEFQSTTHVSQEQEKEQVEGHLRVCLGIGTAWEPTITTNPSEPLLSEAAYLAMGFQEFDAPNALKGLLDFSINKGDRGETLTLLLITLARDAAVRAANDRIFSVVQLITHLFRLSEEMKEDEAERVLNCPTLLDFMRSSPSIGSERSSNPHTFRETFTKCLCYFNHFVKPHQHCIINRKYLAALYHRGAAVLCTNNREAVDIVVPFLHDATLDTPIESARFGAILCQVKNDQRYGNKPNLDLFEVMDPYEINLFDEGDEPIPIIRIVFALAATTPSLQVIEPEVVASPVLDNAVPFVAYDIWCAGISPSVFRPIDDRQQNVWAALLQASYGWRTLYQGQNEREAESRMSMNPGMAEDDGHWSKWMRFT
ncbi:hypothetical protein JAAARDRAFT_210966 [Jaapia argillacea MUCL 33604]|uniref:Uncharacterized protein n=1 Tax=Jaapia argillacea MUCL 33604 TaxID=933084 RepID=A0A067P9T7_9AGAM|nr:hypothetical protein JAAARDRAFT_210966 [Jaapia argillacea MUCL 33604]